ncbi:glycosyltransferase, partial [Desulfonatronospira sp. MSAO_Bac3]|uniref:glycosyltransferase family 4 protein n=1 Tax=Desulfonatronospira sp. MSAO_Bac3 TaxID=2293857 RepID=UPI0025799664
MLRALGQTDQAAYIADLLLKNLAHNDNIPLDRPFLPPSGDFDHQPVQDTLAGWLRSALEKAKEPSQSISDTQGQQAPSAPADPETPPQPKSQAKKIGRNAKCPCGSGKKVKKCCGEDVVNRDVHSTHSTKVDESERYSNIDKPVDQYSEARLILKDEKPPQTECLNIAMITPFFWPAQAGMEMFFHNLATEFTKKGHNISLFAPEYKSNYKEIDADYQLIRFEKVDDLARNFSRIHQQNKFDVILVQSAWQAASIALKLKEKFGVPVILRTHGLDIQKDAEVGYGWRLDPEKDKVICDNLRRVDACIAISSHVKKEIQEIDSSIPVEVINNGVDTEYFNPEKNNWVSNKFNIPRKHFKILMVGRNNKKKSFHLGLEAFALALKQNPDMTLIHAGQQENGVDLKKHARQLGISDNFVQTGKVDYYQINKLYQSCDIFLFPSKAETFGSVTIEAMACGLPCIEFDYGANWDKIEHGVNGFIIPYGDTNSMSERILDLVSDKDKY